MKLHFDPVKHKYFYNNKELTSATKFIGGFFPKFDVDTISKRVAAKQGVPVQDILNEWAKKRDDSCDFGTFVHELIEAHIISCLMGCDRFEALKAIKLPIDASDKLISTVNSFKKFIFDHDITWDSTEKQVFSEELGIAGTIDAIGTMSDGSKVIIDWKTNKSIDLKPKFNKYCSIPLVHVPDTNFAKYTLQLSLYRYILQENYDTKIDNMYLVHLTEKKYELIPVDYAIDDIISITTFDKRVEEFKL